MREPPLSIFLAGATGLVGHETVQALLGAPDEVRLHTFTRRPLAHPSPSFSNHVVDFDALESSIGALGRTCDVAICTLGTTIAQAGSRAQFEKVDKDYVLAFARAAQQAGCRHFLVVTALGASSRSLTFYNRVKGDVEAALIALDFPALTIARPSLLLGERSEKRLGETLAAPFSKLLPKRLRGIEGRTVGRALARLALAPSRGVRGVPSNELAELGR